MNTIAQKIGILTWTFYFLISITGVSLHNFYCHCTGKAYISFFSIDKNCKEQEEKDDKKDTCCKKLSLKHSSHFAEQETEDCCTPNSKVLKAKIDVLAGAQLAELPMFSSAIIAPKLPKITFSYSFLPKVKLQTRPPPRLYGTDLRDFIQSYLC